MGLYSCKERIYEDYQLLISKSLQGLAVKEDVREQLQACIEEAQQEQEH